jgi:metal iron transporter
MIVIIAKVHVNWGNAFLGYVPSKYIFSSGGIYTCTYDDDFQLDLAAY